MTLTNATIAAAQPGDTIRDDEVKGLQLRAFPNRKSFYLYYRTRSGEERKPKLGDSGVMTIKDARRLAKEMLLEVAAGKDPSGKWKSDRAGMTVNEVIDLYLELRAANPHKKKQKKHSIAQRDSLIAHVRKHIGTTKIAALDLADVESMHAKISKTAPVAANRVITFVSTLLKFAIKHKQRPLGSNFCDLVERNAEGKRKRYMKPGDEAKAIGAALRARLYGREHEATISVYLLLLTGARRGEIANAKEVDRQGDRLLVHEHKTDGTMGTKVVHLPEVAQAFLDDPLRPAHRRKGYLVGVADPWKLWKKVRTEAGCPDLRIHDLRHSFASFGISNKVGLSTVAELLSHASTQTTKRYAHLMDEAANEAANQIGNAVTAALAEEKK